MLEHILWVEKYRPKTIANCVLPANLKQTFQSFVDNDYVPNLLLCGTAGIGKTTVARALLEQLDCDYIVINGSLNGNIDTLRNDIQNFASSVSLSGGRKYVILDEADYLNANSTQPALRNFMEEFSQNCGFILTCNFRNRIIEPLHSRCSVIDFKITSDEASKLAAQFYKRAVSILQTQHIEFQKETVARVIQKFYPDWRRVLNELQRYSSTGTLSNEMFGDHSDSTIADVVDLIKNKDFTGLRNWVAENKDLDQTTIFRGLFDRLSVTLAPEAAASLILTLAKYQYQAAFVADHEINTLACMIEIMADCQHEPF